MKAGAGILRPILTAENISKIFRNVRRMSLDKDPDRSSIRALDNVHLALHENEILGILGQSGSGKTTLVRTMLRLTGADSGSVFLHQDGKKEDIFTFSRDEMTQRVRPLIRMIFQHPDAVMNPAYTVRQIIGQGNRGQHMGRKSLAELLDMVDLGSDYANKYPHELSGGEKRRVSICRALITDPKIIFADEAVSGLDMTIKKNILNLFYGLCKDRQISMIFISHDIATISWLCSRIAVMYSGRFVEVGPSDTIEKTYGRHPYSRLLYNACIRLNEPVKSIQVKCSDSHNQMLTQGCVYAPYCTRDEILKKQCRNETPVLKPVAKNRPDHLVACHFPEK